MNVPNHPIYDIEAAIYLANRRCWPDVAQDDTGTDRLVANLDQRMGLMLLTHYLRRLPCSEEGAVYVLGLINQLADAGVLA